MFGYLRIRIDFGEKHTQTRENFCNMATFKSVAFAIFFFFFLPTQNKTKKDFLFLLITHRKKKKKKQLISLFGIKEKYG